MLKPLILAFLVAPWIRSTSAQPSPIWSYQDQIVIDTPMNAEGVFHAVLPNGNAILYGARTSEILSNRFDASSLVSAAIAPSLRADVDETQYRVLGTAQNSVLLTLTQQSGVSQFEQTLLLLNETGQARWARQLETDRALFLPNGDLITVSGSLVSRLAGTDGRTLWQVNLLELEPFATTSFIRGFTANADALVLEYQLESKPGRTGNTQGVEQVTSFDIATGRLLWRKAAPFDSVGAAICEPEFVNGNIRSVNAAFIGGIFKAVVRMRRADGTELWQRELPFALADSDTVQCASVAAPGGALIALTNAGQVHFSRINSADGQLQWLVSRASVSTRETQLIGNTELAVYFDGEPLKARAISFLDGSNLWENPLTSSVPGAGSAQAQLRLEGNSLVVVTSGSTGRAFLQEVKYALDTGVESAQRRLFGVRRENRNFTVSYDGSQPASPIPIVLSPNLGAAGRTLSLRRLSPQAGNIERSVVIDTSLTVIPEFSSAAILTADSTSVWIKGTGVADISGVSSSTLLRVNFDGEILWSDTVYGVFQNTTLANPKHIVLSGYLCITAGPCSNSASGQLQQRTRVLNAQTGAVTRSSDFPIYYAASVGDDFAWADSRNPARLSAFDLLGAERWSQSFAASSGSNTPNAVALTPLLNDFALAQTVSSIFGGSRRSRIGRYARTSGALLWERVFESVSNSSVVMQPDAAALLYSTRRRDDDTGALLGGDMVYLDAQTGATRHSWAVGETSGVTSGHSIRPFGLIQSNLSAVRQFRSLGSDLDARHLYYTRQNADLTTGVLTPEHVFQASIGDALRGADSWGTTAILSDGSMLALNTLNQSNGALRTRLERWPAPSDAAAGDVRLTTDAIDNLVTGLGSSVSVTLRIENASAQPVMAQLGFLDSTTGTYATVRTCQANAGSVCPQIGLSTAQPLTIAANDVLNVSFEISDPKFAQVRNFSATAGGTFFVLPEYAFGDRMLANNLATVMVRGAGSGDGFE